MDPRAIWLSENFRLSDFLGNHSVYAKGLANPFSGLHKDKARIENAKALCAHALEPILASYGPLSICYGFISPDFSRKTVKYQDPDTPSHHRWDLGAAADIICHKWVQGIAHEPALEQLFADRDTRTSPALLAHCIDREGIPYSRLISYSESPALCIAVSAREVSMQAPRKAFYENRYVGKPKAKPEYLQLASQQARARVVKELQQDGLPVPWRGGGFPSYHGGGVRQYQHMRVSKYTTVLDWLFSLKSISEGAKNIPALTSAEVQDSFGAAGITFDYLQDNLPGTRLRVLGGYVCRSHPDFDKGNDWRRRSIYIELGASKSLPPDEFHGVAHRLLPAGFSCEETDYGLRIQVDVEAALDGVLDLA